MNMTPSAKNSSLWAQIIAAVWIAGWSAYKFLSNADNIDMADVMLSGLAIAACFTPVYFSIIMEKVRDIRFNGGNSSSSSTTVKTTMVSDMSVGDAEMVIPEGAAR